MYYFVYHKASTVIIKSFQLESSAKRSATCMNRNAGGESYAYTDSVTYDKSVRSSKKVKNLMTGKEIEIDSNTPLCCDPSSETYWSM